MLPQGNLRLQSLVSAAGLLTVAFLRLSIEQRGGTEPLRGCVGKYLWMRSRVRTCASRAWNSSLCQFRIDSSSQLLQPRRHHASRQLVFTIETRVRVYRRRDTRSPSWTLHRIRPNLRLVGTIGRRVRRCGGCPVQRHKRSPMKMRQYGPRGPPPGETTLPPHAGFGERLIGRSDPECPQVD
jgi:hypothetical protein